jgi:hypothetical protein
MNKEGRSLARDDELARFVPQEVVIALRDKMRSE